MDRAQEDYLKLLYKEYNKAESASATVKTSFLANLMKISNAAVTDMFKKLQRDEFITYFPYKGARLTEKGREIGAQITRRHRLWELYLHDVLGFSWSEVHEEAERLEHASSDKLIDRIEEQLNFPLTDPHGAPIPSKTGDLPIDQTLSLLNLDPGNSGVVRRVQGLGPTLLNYLQSIHLSLDDSITVVTKNKVDHSVLVCIKGVEHVLDQDFARAIFVDCVDKKDVVTED